MSSRKILFIFPGQGSQYAGMGSDLIEEFPAAREVYERASDVVKYDMRELSFRNPRGELDQTRFTQPALLTHEYACLEALKSVAGDVRPELAAGHSLGEYTALVCAGALDFRTAVSLVQFRGQAMQAAVPAGQGAMAAILGLDDADVEAACQEAAGGEIVQAANFNSPGQVVIAGTASAVDRAIEIAKSKGAKRAIKLSVSVPSHSALMEPAAERLRERLAATQFAQPEVRDIYTVDVRRHESVDGIRQALVEQLVKPVRWTATIQAIVGGGARAVVECGPGRVLTGLNRRIEKNKDIAMLAIEDGESLQQALQICRELA